MQPVFASFPGLPAGQSESLDRMAEADNYNDWLFARAAPFLGRRVLDFGAGIGTFTAALAARAEVVAVEPDPELAAALRARFAADPRVTVVEGDAGWLEDSGVHGDFDAVVCLNVLEHIRDDEAVLRGLRDCLVPGGHLLALVPAHAALYGRIDRRVGHERRYSRRGLCSTIERAGLEPVDARYVNPVGAIGWLASSRLLKREQVPVGPLRAYDRLVPLLRRLDKLRFPFGLSVWAVARRA